MKAVENILSIPTRLIKNKYFNLGFKVILVLLVTFAIYRQVFSKENIDEIWTLFLASMSTKNLVWLGIAIGLMPINWAFETMKFRTLIDRFEKQNFWRSYQAIMAGVTFSILTPNRIGEYGGRVLLVKPENNWKAVIATLVGSFSQLLVLLTMGLISMIFFANIYLDMEPFMLTGFLFLGSIFIFAMLFVFFNISVLVPVAKKIPFYNRFKKVFKNLKLLNQYDSTELSKTLFYSFCRYGIYTLQYYFIVKFFGIEIGFTAAIIGIGTIFLLQTSIPVIPLMGLIVRGKVALFVWGIFSNNSIAILASTFGLWILNLIVPALLGMIFIANINVLKNMGYESKKNK